MELLAAEQPTSDEVVAFLSVTDWEAQSGGAGVDHIDDMAETMQYVIELDLKKQKLGVELEVETSTKHIQVARSTSHTPETRDAAIFEQVRVLVSLIDVAPRAPAAPRWVAARRERRVRA